MILDIIATVLLFFTWILIFVNACKKEKMTGSEFFNCAIVTVTLLLPIYCIWK